MLSGFVKNDLKPQNFNEPQTTQQQTFNKFLKTFSL